MEYLNVFYDIFREDLSSLQSGFLSGEKYKTYLNNRHPYVFTHFSITVQKKESEQFLITKSLETPFYKYEHRWVKEGQKSTPLQEIDRELIQFLLEHTNIYKSDIKEVYIHKTGDSYVLDIFLNRSYGTVSNLELCYYYYYLKMREAYHKITEHLHQLYFNEQLSERQRTNKIRKCQLKLQYYSAILEKKYLREIPKLTPLYKSMQDVFGCIHRCIDKVIIYMEACFAHYLDKELGISYEQRLAFISSYYDRTQKLIQSFKKQNLPGAIESELCKPLYKIQSDSFQTLSYVQRDFYRTYIDLFDRMFTKYETVVDDQIYHLVIALDVNTHILGQAMTKELINRLNEFDTEIEKQTYLYKQLMVVEEIPVTAKISYRPEFPSLKDYLIRYLKKRIELSRKTYQIELHHIKKGSRTVIGGVTMESPQTSKRKINLTVSEFSLFARLFSEIGVVSLKDGEKQNYFKFLSKTYHSRDSDRISVHSIRNGFYNASPETCKKVQSHLLEMLDKLRKLKELKSL